MRSTLLAAAAVLSLGFSTMAFAAGGGGGSESLSTPAKPVDPNFTRAKAMIEANRTTRTRCRSCSRSSPRTRGMPTPTT